MQIAPPPESEADRLQALFDYDVLDTDTDVAFDSLTQLASSICRTPIALVSLIDENRQWFKSHHGLDARETPRDFAFCAHAILQEDVFEVADSREDERFHDNPLVTDSPEVIFYAGAPLKTPDGHNIGTLCVIDHKPSELNEEQKEQLRILASQVVAQLELTKQISIKEQHYAELMKLTKSIEKRNVELDAFSSRAAHDLNGPIRQISQIARFCLDDLEEGDTSELESNCIEVIRRCDNLRILTRDIFDLTRAEASVSKLEAINFKKLRLQILNSVEDLLEDSDVVVDIKVNVNKAFLSEQIRLQQVLHNLVSNAIKYANPAQQSRHVSVHIDDADSGVTVQVKDNGIGIPSDRHDRVFQAFERFHSDVADGSGLGLSIVKKHVDALEGSIAFSSDSSGTEFSISLPDIPPVID